MPHVANGLIDHELMGETMSAYNSSRSTYLSMAFPPGMVEALERLHAESPNGVSKSVYIYDLIARETLWASSSVVAILGYGDDDTALMGPLGLVNLIHPDDLNKVLDHYQKFDTLQSGKVIVIEYQMKRADGTWSRLRSQETPLAIADDGFPVQILGIVQDVSQSDLNAPAWSTLFDQSMYDVN